MARAEFDQEADYYLDLGLIEQAVAFFLDLDAPEDQAAWFETAVDRCAFLAWNMSQRGSRVRFCTQDVDWQLPEEADVYTILKYLALVYPKPGKPLPASNDRNVFQIIFSASPDRLRASGWELGGSNIRLLIPDHTSAHAD